MEIDLSGSSSPTPPKYGNNKISKTDDDVALEYEQHYKWGLATQIVSIIDLALGIVGIISSVIFTIVMIYVTTKMKNGNLRQDIQDSFPGLEPENENAYLGKIFAEISLWAIVCCIHTWAANQLKSGTTQNKGLTSRETLRRCSIWRNLAIIFLLMIFGYYVNPHYNRMYFWLWVMLRLVSIALVSIHIQERKQEFKLLDKTRQKYTETTHQIFEEQA